MGWPASQRDQTPVGIEPGISLRPGDSVRMVHFSYVVDFDLLPLDDE